MQFGEFDGQVVMNYSYQQDKLDAIKSLEKS